MPHSLDRRCKGAQTSVTVFACLCLDCGKECGPGNQEAPVLSEAATDRVCPPRGQLPMDQDVAFLLSTSQLATFHDFQKISWNKKSMQTI